ncbi:MAG: nickel-dependent lactate racemase [Youngiibacter sp.]|nr:nickel-dependent lactate racemase [Youngiibacter sp.]
MHFVDFPEITLTIQGMEDVRIPKMMKVRQIYDKNRIEDIEGWIRKELETKLPEEQKVSLKGKRICITVGSRGIPDIDRIVKAVLDWLKEKGANPFIVPAMGSHGGGTAEGQKEFIAGYGITEESMGVPILSSMDTVKLGELEDGTPVYCDKYAFESDGIIVFNKIKPHTDFRGEHESGLAKMCAIGLAKHVGASYFHMMGFPTFAERIPKVARMFLDKAPIAFGLGVVQNAYDEISILEVIPNDQIMEIDAELLKAAKEKIANFKMKDIDVLIIDEIGKNISGNGHDPNITGRSNSKGFEDVLDCKKMFVRGITEVSHHNACGLSAADITTRRVMNDIDLDVTWTNVVTATMLNGAKLPMYVNSDKEAIRVCIRTCNGIDFDKAKIVRIVNTAEMENIMVSEAYYDELKNREDIIILSEPFEMQFDEQGYLID